MVNFAEFIKTPAAKGVTILEMAMGMMIIAVLSVGVSSLVRTGIESQMAERTNQQMQVISNTIVDDLRMDFRQADSVTINGNTLRLSVANLNAANPNVQVTYSLNAGRFSRAAGGRTKVYNDSGAYPNLLVNCVPANCFTEDGRQIQLKNLTVEQTVAGNSVIDKFGKPNYQVHNIAFDVASRQEFQ